MAPFRASNFNLKELIAGVVLTDAFLAPAQPLDDKSDAGGSFPDLLSPDVMVDASD
jgi:hypothetical protein